ncbi:putative toxin-antitoxin system toxin component, PIN family [bacterium]|nr:putative toxin-antitoxin system toxin component, PIN family [bacterium]
MNIVLDTNVLVSGLLSPFGNSADILRLVLSNRLYLCVDARILTEYREVLHRPKFQFDNSRVEILIDYIHKIGVLINSTPLSNTMSDPDDVPFLEVAVSGGAEYLVTGNIGHFPAKYGNVQIITPAELMTKYREA